METSNIFLLLASGAVSFGLGRVFVHFRDKKREKQVREQAAQARRDQPVEPTAKNRSKRKRQLLKLHKLEKDQGGQQH